MAGSTAQNLSRRLETALGPARGGEVPWQSGHGLFMGQLARGLIMVALDILVILLFLPFRINAYSHGVTLTAHGLALDLVGLFDGLSLVFMALLIWDLVASYRALEHTQTLQSNVPAAELVDDLHKRLGARGADVSITDTRAAPTLRVTSLTLRERYAPLRVLSSPLGWVTWAGAESLLAVPETLYNHPKWGQEIHQSVLEILGWPKDTPPRKPISEEVA